MKAKKIVIAIVMVAVVTLAIAWYGREDNANADNREGILVEKQEGAEEVACLLVKRGQLCDRM